MVDQIQPLPRIDLTTLKVNQAFIILLLILAFILNLPWLVAVVFLVMALGTGVGVPGFKPVYQYLLKPANLAKPEIVQDNPEPHRFAQGFGAFVLLIAVLSLGSGSVVLGWSLTWLVVALAAINLFAGFCAGCFVYYWLSRLGVPGFTKAPPPNTIPGMRPRLET